MSQREGDPKVKTCVNFSTGLATITPYGGYEVTLCIFPHDLFPEINYLVQEVTGAAGFKKAPYFGLYSVDGYAFKCVQFMKIMDRSLNNANPGRLKILAEFGFRDPDPEIRRSDVLLRYWTYKKGTSGDYFTSRSPKEDLVWLVRRIDPFSRGYKGTERLIVTEDINSYINRPRQGLAAEITGKVTNLFPVRKSPAFSPAQPI